MWIWIVANLGLVWLTSVVGIWFEGTPSIPGASIIRTVVGDGAAAGLDRLAHGLLAFLS